MVLLIVYISRLALDHYRSWNTCLIDLTDSVNVLYGHNGLGKTNIVEAIEFLSTGSSHRVNSSQPLIQRGYKQATIRANLEIPSQAGSSQQGSSRQEFARQTERFTVTIPIRGANRVRVNNNSSLYMRDIVGQIKTVVFAPEDQWLLSLDPSRRRRFLDDAGIQLIPEYYDLSQKYSHIARQRVALLKNMGSGQRESSADDYTGLEIWTGQLISTGLSLSTMRQKIVEKLSPLFSEIYAQLAGSEHKAQLAYHPSFAEIFDQSDDPFTLISNHFQRLFPGELAQGRNLIGPHRDDLDFSLHGMPAKEYASNGEMWTMALALKMSLFQLLSENLLSESSVSAGAGKPILILDDVFSQLDTSRREKIVDFSQQQEQVLVTAASENDIPLEFISNSQAEVNLCNVEEIKADADREETITGEFSSGETSYEA